MKKLIMKNWILGVICVVLLLGNSICAQDLSATSEDEELLMASQKDLPYGGACFLNYGFSLSGHVGLRQTYPRISGIFNTSNTKGTKLDLQDDLGVDDYSTDFLVGAEIGWSGLRVHFTYSQAEFSGSKTLTQDVTIDGTTFTVGGKLDSKIDLEFWRVLVSYTVYANVNFGAGFDLEFDAIALDYSFTSGTRKEEGDHLIPLLRPGFHIDFAFSKPLVFTLACNGMMFAYDDVNLATAHASLTARWYVGENFFLFAEGTYEYLRIDSSRNEDFDGQILFHSWTASAGLGVRF